MPIPFSDLKLNKQLLMAIQEMEYQHTTPIQAQAIPPALAGQDIMGIAQTGTGKTAAYLIPVLMKLKYAQGAHPRALVLAPTRELVQQIFEVLEKLSRYVDLRSVALYGGLGPKKQIEALSQGQDILVSTPGRFLDLYFRQAFHPRSIKTLVLDEADKMMDMGFMPQINQILEVIPQKRQNLLFSATMPEKVVKLSEDFLEYPTRIEISPQATAAETVDQFYYAVPNLKTKINLLKLLLDDQARFQKVIVFARTRKNADNVYKFLQRKLGLEEQEIRVIHANKDQNARLNAMRSFKEGDTRILVSTDVVARGIDVSMVSQVINFDVPLIHEDYIHRIGRTGRAEESGEAITFVTEADLYHLREIEKIMKQKVAELALPADLEIIETGFEEQQAMAREIDRQKRKENPDFKGAFHQKKSKSSPKHRSFPARSNRSSGKKRRK
ncbi:MAG: DEAD/DEAH box helicase, partial [Bacteroidota bacterium]